MSAMGAGRVITVSPRESLGRLEQLVLARLDRDGVAPLAAVTADTSQRRQLWRLRKRLLMAGLENVYWGDHADGTTHLTVFPAGDQRPGWFGGPDGAPPEPGDC